MRSSFAEDWPLRMRLPWLTFDAIDRLAAMPWRGKRVFEWGSGGSTLFFADRGAAVTSIEHDEAWYARVRALAPTADVRLVRPEPSDGATHADSHDPAAYLSTDAAFIGRSFRAYACAIDEMPDGALDAIVIDGRARPACIAHAIPKLAPGGVLVVDDAHRDYYFAKTSHLVAPFARERFVGFAPGGAAPKETDLFVRAGGTRRATVGA